VRANQLTVAGIERLAACAAVGLPERYRHLAVLLSKLLALMERLYASAPTQYDDAAWVANRLAEILPLPLDQKQALLVLDDPIKRLDRLAVALGAR